MLFGLSLEQFGIRELLIAYAICYDLALVFLGDLLSGQPDPCPSLTQGLAFNDALVKSALLPFAVASDPFIQEDLEFSSASGREFGSRVVHCRMFFEIYRA